MSAIFSSRREFCFAVAALAAALWSITSGAEEPGPARGVAEVAPEVPYAPTPENLAARAWFQNARFGVFIHWGVYSVLGRGEWVMNNEKMSVEEYEKLCERFNPEKFNADEWVRLFKRAGAKYITITSKHHDGFAMFDAKTGDWDIADRTDFGRDPLQELAEACKKQGLKLFFYHSHLDWHHPDYFPRGKTGHFSDRPPEGDFEKYLQYMDAQLAELLGGRYGDVGGIWFDGWWDQQAKRFDETKDANPRATRLDWHMRRTYDLIHKLQPACLIGNNHHIAPFAGEDFQMFERDLPGQNKGGHSPDAVIGELPLETCDTINHSWGYNADDHHFKSLTELVHYLIRAAGNNANFLLNVGPRPDGTIDPESQQRLLELGRWINENEQSFRGTHGGPVPPQTWGVSTHQGKTVYLHILDVSQVDEDGWLSLSGTEELQAHRLQFITPQADLLEKRDERGCLEIKIPPGFEIPDYIVKGESL